jgi:hypothetical protein
MLKQTVLFLFVSVFLVGATAWFTFSPLIVQGQADISKSTDRFQKDMQVEIYESLATIKNQSFRETNKEQVAEAIDKLGKLKSTEAISDLVELITFKIQPKAEVKNDFFVVEHHTITNFDRFPAMSALSQIGEPALPDLIKLIEKEDADSIASNNALEVVRAIFKENNTALAYLQQKADESIILEGKQRLESAAGKTAELVERLKKFDEAKTEKVKPQ